MTVLVTGGAGFIGSHVVRRVMTQHEVHVIDDLSTGRRESVPPGISLDTFDLSTTEPSAIADVLERRHVNAVIHLAALHFIPACLADPIRTFRINVLGTFNLYQALRLAGGCESLVLASTADVYPVVSQRHTESGPVAPANIYGTTKLLAEELTSFWSRENEPSRCTSLRFSNVYGPGETNPHVVPDVLERLNDRSAPQINMGYLGAERDFVYVTDVANAVAASLDRETPGYRVYNVSTGVATSIRTVVRLLQDAVGDTRPIHEQAARFRSFDRKSLVLDNSRLSRELGWRPAVGLKQGLHELVDV